MKRTATLAAVVTAAALSFAACGGGVTQGMAGDAGVDAVATSGCGTLSACCATLPSTFQSLCTLVVGQGNASDCATELSQLLGEGYCTSQTGPGDAGDASTQGHPDAQGGMPDGQTGPGPDGSSPPPPPPPGCTNTTCTSPQVCISLPGSTTGTCGPPCQGDGDCPGWLTCQSGSCTQCYQTAVGDAGMSVSSCAAGQQCTWATPPRGAQCSSNAACGLGGYCQGGNCAPIEVCAECLGGCTTCTSNAQCNAGEVCEGQLCVTCTSNSQCGSSATCTATHTGMQCTCTQNTDCASGETCSSGICSPNGGGGCATGGPSSCQNGQACINNACGPCSTFEDCNTNPYGGPGQLSGLACIGGVCTACTSNSQCGGGMACVGGTCGTCSTNTQCGATGQCTDGYCACTTSSQCGSGQRCGWGVCVSM
jgi:hypothetical protein